MISRTKLGIFFPLKFLLFNLEVSIRFCLLLTPKPASTFFFNKLSALVLNYDSVVPNFKIYVNDSTKVSATDFLNIATSS